MDPIPSTLSEAAILVLNTPDADQKVMVLISLSYLYSVSTH